MQYFALILLFATLFTTFLREAEGRCCCRSSKLAITCIGSSRRKYESLCKTDFSAAAETAPFDLRLAVAGGLAGGLTNFILYPFDTLKTMRQADKSLVNMRAAFMKLASQGGAGLRSAYGGVVPAVVGSVPSSAIYFGTYELAKRFLSSNNPYNVTIPRPTVHMLAAASGNILSAVIFVPKDLIKQRVQASRTGSLALTADAVEVLSSRGMLARADPGSVLSVMGDIYRKNGLLGFYPTFTATLARNIPSAVLRFTVYEELRIRMIRRRQQLRTTDALLPSSPPSPSSSFSSDLTAAEVMGFVLAGSVASAFASAICTPLDVVKTRIATGILPSSTSLVGGLRTIFAQEGLHGLYAGMNGRIMGSSLFGGIGFASFETFKMMLGYEDLKRSSTDAMCPRESTRAS